jgi:hypothetical protein
MNSLCACGVSDWMDTTVQCARTERRSSAMLFVTNEIMLPKNQRAQTSEANE